jgi:outer membrane protein OmpA-like peptidoglycan-associated protein
VTISRNGDVRPVSAIAAYGEIAALPERTNISGTYVQYNNPYDNSGTFRTVPDRKDPWYLRVVTVGSDGVNGEQCFDGHLGDSYPGRRNGRVWTWTANHHTGTFVADDDGSVLIGTDGSGSYWVRTDQHPKYCEPQVTGNGPVNVVVLESTGWQHLYPVTNDDEAKTARRYRFTHIGAAMLDQQTLQSTSTLIFNGLCNADDLIATAQGKMIADWVSSGHKLLIYDADMCHDPTHYAMLPYQFKSNNPGAVGAKGDRLIEVEDDTLGTSDPDDKAHYFDPKVYAVNNNQLGDANTVTTQDSHWCGHLFGTNANHVNGFMQMYTNYGNGLIIYDGFDHDDGDVDSYRRIRMLELDQPIPADLPCTQQASLAFVIEPNRAGKFVPGKATTLTFPMELLANQGWKGHVNIATSGDFKGGITPNSFDIAGGTKPLSVAVSIPANAKAGTYNVIVTGSSADKQTAQAAIQLTAAVPIVKQFQQRRIRIYGIHFDVDKSTIKPQSEPVIAQIAAVMKQNPVWRFRVEGHTDSDGGYAHNMALSQARAQSVVDDLVKRYHVARSRLVAAGYGYSHPVASNATAGGKALNRRVELVRL